MGEIIKTSKGFKSFKAKEHDEKLQKIILKFDQFAKKTPLLVNFS